MSESKVAYSNKNPRLNIFYWIFGLMIVVLLCVLAYRQIFLYEKYSSERDRQSLRRIIKPGARGDIFDRNGILIVGNRPDFSAVVYKERAREEYYGEYMRLKRIIQSSGGKVKPLEIRDLANRNIYNGYLKTINEILGTDYSFDYEAFKKKHSAYSIMPIPLIGNLSLKEHSILAERLSVNSPIELTTETARYYPFNSAAAQALGYVKQAEEDIDDHVPGDGLRTYSYQGKKGAVGVEKAFDDKLSGKFGTEIWLVDNNANRYEDILKLQPQKGGDIRVSLDINLQLVAEAALKGRKGALVLLDVNTGEILAMASSPTYDLNLSSPKFFNRQFEEILNSGAMFNKATGGLYLPGSTFKLVVAVAGLEEGAITLNSTSNCTGGFMVGNRRFPCNSRYGHGHVNLSDAIAKSCNVFFYEHGLKTGIDQISEIAKGFGLDSSTGIEIGDRFRGTIVGNPEYKKKYHSEQGPWLKGDTANVSIGQGFVRQTPIQMACFAASLARGETRTKASIMHDTNRITDTNYHNAKKIKISEEEYGAIVHGMEMAVNSGTCKRAAISGIRIAAKSGTAQIMENHRPLDLAWMVAFAPIEKPRVAIAVVIEGESLNDVSGGASAGPVVNTVFKKVFEAR